MIKNYYLLNNTVSMIYASLPNSLGKFNYYKFLSHGASHILAKNMDFTISLKII